jgi:hypothetical protein
VAASSAKDHIGKLWPLWMNSKEQLQKRHKELQILACRPFYCHRDGQTEQDHQHRELYQL